MNKNEKNIRRIILNPSCPPKVAAEGIRLLVLSDLVKGTKL